MTDIVTLLLFILLIVSALQRTDERQYAAMVFVSLAVIHHVFADNLNGWLYYFSAAMFDAFVVLFTLKLRILSRAIKTLHDICYASIVLNGLGWAAWMLYLPPDPYNASFIVLYSWAIINLLRKDANNVDRDYSVGVGHRYVFTSSDQNHQRHTGSQE